MLFRSVLPFLGVEMAENRLAMVSEWMQRGNIMEFVAADPAVDRLGLVRFSLKLLTLLFSYDHLMAVA